MCADRNFALTRSLRGARTVKNFSEIDSKSAKANTQHQFFAE